MPIESPSLEIRNEEQLAAASIAFTSGGLTTDRVKAQIATREELLKLIEAGLDDPICPELTNANPSSPHTVLLEAFSWALSQQAHKFNQVPRQNLIAFANLFGIEPRAATAAETTLRFTVDPPPATDVTIPAGTEISTADDAYVFQTVNQLLIPYGDVTGDTKARRTLTGHMLLQPALLTKLIDPIAFVTAVTNPDAIDSGTEEESLESVLDRVRRYQKRGERIVSTKDLEEAIGEDAMNGNGVVRAFPFIKNGNFLTQTEPLVGHTTCVVMTRTGDTIDAIVKAKISALLDTAVGNQFIYIADAMFVNFNVDVDIKINTGSPQGTVLAAAEKNLRAFYAPSRAQFGRPILRSEIIAVIEGTEGVDRIVVPEIFGNSDDPRQILTEPVGDKKLKEYELPKLVDVTVNVV
jgi:uncharacterized phage protein gp47/JayE